LDRAQYLEIRKKLNLKHQASALAIFMAQNALLIAAITFIWLEFNDSIFRFLTIPLISAFIFRNFSMMHEAVHKSASKNIFINDIVGLMTGAVCLLAYEPWKRSHLEHHVWSGNIDKDPVTAIITAFPKMSPFTQNTLSFFWMIWFPMLACMQYVVFWWLAAKIYLKKPSAHLLMSLVVPAFFWTALFTFTSTAFAMTALLPSLILYMVAVEVVNLPHHLQLPQYRGDTKLMMWEQYKIARSCVYPRWFARLVALNFNYHIEHHMYPDVAWYHLEQLHNQVIGSLKNSYNTDPYFRWILDNKRLPINEVLKAQNENLPLKKAV
jgi:acyl-lipid omega-6 desaturase (Delta-12 desaturase)